MEHGYREPVYTIGIAAKLLKVCPATLRIWEKRGLIRPVRFGKNRFYSQCDVDRLEYIKELIRKKRLNIQGVKAMLNITRCWEIKKCKPTERKLCPVYLKYGRTKF